MIRTAQIGWTASGGWTEPRTSPDGAPDLVLMFAGPAALEDTAPLAALRERFPGAVQFGCSTAGEIADTEVFAGSLRATAIWFEHTRVRGVRVSVSDDDDGYEAGHRVAQALAAPDLAHVLVLSDGMRVNGSALARGLVDVLPQGVGVSGALSGDDVRFGTTTVWLDGEPTEGIVAAIGLYGDRLGSACASRGGWDAFGPERLITSSRGNVLLELDGRSALGLYKTYLGGAAVGLPATGLHFPLSLRDDTHGAGKVRTILAVDEDAQSMTFAGDVPQGTYVRLMKANTDRLIDGASRAADRASTGGQAVQLAVLIGCVGRRLVLKQRVEEEVEAVREVLGPEATLTGLYAYGELSPFEPGGRLELHNQTMTITTFWEH